MLLLACCPLLAQLLRFNVPAKTGSTSLFAILSHDEGFMEAASTTDANLSSTNVPVGVCGSHISVSRLGHADDGSEWLSEHPDGTLAVILREPCERFVSSFHYARQRLAHDTAHKRFTNDVKTHLIDQIVNTSQTPIDFARLLLKDPRARQSWMALPRDRLPHSMMCSLNHILGESCGFVPLHRYVPTTDAARMRVGCLPCVGIDVRRIVGSVLGPSKASSCQLQEEAHENVHHASQTATTHAAPAADLCSSVAALYKEDVALWERWCASRTASCRR